MNQLRTLLLLIAFIFGWCSAFSQDSTPRLWVNELLNAIRNDLARPPVHARNLHHLSLGMYDAWAVYQPGQNTLFLGKTYNDFVCPFLGQVLPQTDQDRINAQETAMSFFAYRLIRHRFASSPGAFLTYQSIESLMLDLGLDPTFNSIDYLNEGPAAMGNYLAEKLIQYGLQDNSNEVNNYANQYYVTVNPPVEPELSGNPNMIEPNRWQAISLTNAVDQAGNPVIGVPPFVAPEWGNVNTFALVSEDAVDLTRDGEVYRVYHLPDAPPFLDTTVQTELEDFFKWNFLMVSVWQSHLDPTDNVMWDISPASIGNIQTYPNSWEEYAGFYNFFDGGDAGIGYAQNPITGLPYEPQIVSRADYGRVLAEFWADGIESETPPGHWFEIYNEVSEHPLFDWKWKGQGEVLSHMEYDVKAYLTLGGAMHDAAIAAWSVKGWYDYPRPVSTIRYMAGLGQSSDPLESNFHPGGLPIVPGYVEQVMPGDPLEGTAGEHVGKIKLYTWKGHEYVFNPETDIAGVGWILAENWWPYQRPNFVTPPFAGYVSGHSTFSRAAAEVLTFITGSDYFPGGMSSFIAEQNNFLEFEVGPSQTISLQWATYRDAADQCSLSRIWGGIHPPIDDIPGRKIGEQVGVEAALFTDSILSASLPLLAVQASMDTINSFEIGEQLVLQFNFSSSMDISVLPNILFPTSDIALNGLSLSASLWQDNTTFIAFYTIESSTANYENVVLSVSECWTESGYLMPPQLIPPIFIFDTEPPQLFSSTSNVTTINASQVNADVIIDWYFSENCQSLAPQFDVQSNAQQEINATIDLVNSQWFSPTHYRTFLLLDNVLNNLGEVSVTISDVYDELGNPIVITELNTKVIMVNAQFPLLIAASSSTNSLNSYGAGSNVFAVNLQFNKVMNTGQIPSFYFSAQSAAGQPFSLGSNSSWINDSLLVLSFNNLANEFYDNINFELWLTYLSDGFGNLVEELYTGWDITIDNVRPSVLSIIPSSEYIDFIYEQNNDFFVDIIYSEEMYTGSFPWINVSLNGESFHDLYYDPFSSFWVDGQNFRARFLMDWNLDQISELDFSVNAAMDILLNPQIPIETIDLIEYNGQNLASLDLISQTSNITIYPNPINAPFILNFETDFSSGFELIVTDMYGRVIERINMNEGNGSYHFQNYTNGQYLLYFNSSDKSYKRKLVIHE